MISSAVLGGKMEEQAPTSGFLRFWTSIPGILTASAAVITASGTIYVATLTHNSAPSPPSPNNPTTVTISQPAAQPTDDGNVTLRLDSVNSSISTETGVESMIRDCASGDDGACIEILDTLANGCYQGNGLSCDVLYEVSAIGSDYESYGATCGGRAGTQYADRCRNFDLTA